MNSKKSEDKENWRGIQPLTEIDTETPAPLSCKNSQEVSFPGEAKCQTTKHANKKSISISDATKTSTKKNGVIKAYAANTNMGLVRQTNEDRVSIIMNIAKPKNRDGEAWPRCSFFAVYDGHGGSNWADFLRDNLHLFLIQEESFPAKPRTALMRAFANAESAFLGHIDERDRSGSCAIVVLIVADMWYVANVGDSRAIMSGNHGTWVYPLSKDHRPMSETESARIIQAGGKIYQNQTTQLRNLENGTRLERQLGPYRVLPGRLSVSRTIGDSGAKLTSQGGNPNVVIPTPEIKAFKIQPNYDFILLASDGVFDKASNKEIIHTAWQHILPSQNIHSQCGRVVESVISMSLRKRSMDNLTVVMLAFKNLKDRIKQGTCDM